MNKVVRSSIRRLTQSPRLPGFVPRWLTILPLGAIASMVILSGCIGGESSARAELFHLPKPDRPTLFWASQRFGLGIVEAWTVVPDDRLVRVRVSQAWPRLSYYQRYRLIAGIGRVAAQKQYALVVTDRTNRIVAGYRCSPSNSSPTTDTAGTEPGQCELDLANPAGSNNSESP